MDSMDITRSKSHPKIKRRQCSPILGGHSPTKIFHEVMGISLMKPSRYIYFICSEYKTTHVAWIPHRLHFSKGHGQGLDERGVGALWLALQEHSQPNKNLFLIYFINKVACNEFVSFDYCGCRNTLFFHDGIQIYLLTIMFNSVVLRGLSSRTSHEISFLMVPYVIKYEIFYRCP
jgi:hypothetical protein